MASSSSSSSSRKPVEKKTPKKCTFGSPPPPVKECPVAKAVESLMATSKLVASDTKKPATRQFDSSVLATLRSMLGSATYDFRVSYAGTVTSGTGTIASHYSTDLSQFQEGSALTALFDECKLLKGEVSNLNGQLGGLNGFCYLLGWAPSITATTPTVAIVVRYDHVELFSTSSAVTGKAQKLSYRPRSGRVWGLTTVEGVVPTTDAPVCGCAGTLQWIQLAGTPSSSDVYFGFFVRQLVMLRART
jgi:hypothetical protein